MKKWNNTSKIKMNFKCIVPNCKRKRQNEDEDEDETFHRGRVCSKHFYPSEFDVKDDGRRYLKQEAFPKIVLNESVIEDVSMADDNTEHEDSLSDFGMNEDTLADDFDLMDEDEWIIMEEKEEEITPDTSLHLNCSTPIYKEHNYSKVLRKCKAIVTIDCRVRQIQSLRRSNKLLRKLLKRKDRAHKKENKKFENFTKLSDFVQELILLLLKHHQPNSRPRLYSPIIRKFALTLHYYSPSAYEFVRDELNKCLPHCLTIAEWYRVIDGEPGFTNEALEAISDLQKRTPFQIVVAIVVDGIGMAIRKHIQLVGNKTVGYTDFGGIFPDEDVRLQLAKEALIYIAVGVNFPFKLPFGYFLINSLTGKQLSYLTETGISLISRCGVVPGSLTYDGLRANFAMGKELGCLVDDVTNLITSFEVDGQNVYIFPDMSHMIKLARNFICDEQEFMDGKNRKICWKYFVHLNRFQQSQGFHIANKLRNLHVTYKNQIMKVYLATQLFSRAVADAIEFCDETLELPDFKYSVGTVEFIRVMNDIFDIFNTRDMQDKFYKQPINRNNHSVIMSRLDYIREYLIQLKHNNGSPVYAGKRQTFVVGMLMLIQSLKKYFEEFVERKRLLCFVPTYRQSQDSAEIFNGDMRSFKFSGSNTNPSAIVLKSAYKKSLLHVQFHQKFTGNCQPLESLPILHKSSARPVNKPPHYINEDEFDESLQNSIIISNVGFNWKAHYNVIAHISGYIARRLQTMLKCNFCSNSLIRENENLDEINDIVIEDAEMESIGNENNVFSCENSANAANVSISSKRQWFDIEADEDIGYSSDFHDIEDDEDAGYSSDFYDDDNDMHDNNESVNDCDKELDVGQVAGLVEKYLDLIKKKYRGGLFYPSDSLYRVSILSDITFKVALKNSGGKMLLKEYTLEKLVLNVQRLYLQYSDVIFNDLKAHFRCETSHNTALIQNIANFYLKIRINFLNKTVSANSGKRQKSLHLIHFQGM